MSEIVFLNFNSKTEIKNIDLHVGEGVSALHNNSVILKEISSQNLLLRHPGPT